MSSGLAFCGPITKNGEFGFCYFPVTLDIRGIGLWSEWLNLNQRALPPEDRGHPLR